MMSTDGFSSAIVGDRGVARRLPGEEILCRCWRRTAGEAAEEGQAPLGRVARRGVAAGAQSAVHGSRPNNHRCDKTVGAGQRRSILRRSVGAVAVGRRRRARVRTQGRRLDGSSGVEVERVGSGGTGRSTNAKLVLPGPPQRTFLHSSNRGAGSRRCNEKAQWRSRGRK